MFDMYLFIFFILYEKYIREYLYHLLYILNDMIRYKKIYNALKNKILNKNKKLWLPINNYNCDTYNTNSWFTIGEQHSLIKNKIINKNISLCDDDGKLPEGIIKSRKYYIYPNEEQKDILLNWMKYYLIMYNQTILYFKTNYFNKKKISLDWKKVRTYNLKDIKESIIKNSQLDKYKKNTKINTHVLDQAIQEATKNYIACLTNIKRGNIKKFNLRYLKLTKPNKNITVEHVFVSKNKNTFCSTIFKEEFITPNFKFSNITSDFKIQYEEKKKLFSLLIPIKEKTKEKHQIKNSCGIDMGLRTFATCFSNNKIITIGNNMQNLIKKYIHKIDGINNNIDIKNKRKKILEHKYTNKMNNKIDDLHFKTINYLTNNFGNIIIEIGRAHV